MMLPSLSDRPSRREERQGVGSKGGSRSSRGERTRVDAAELERMHRAVGETAQVVLNSAALQMLAMKQPLPSKRPLMRVHNGRLLFTGADGFANDISFLADSPGHGSNVTAAAHKPRPSRSPSPPPPAARRQHSSVAAEALPSSRTEAVAVANHLRARLDGLPDDAELEHELPLWNDALVEVVRQVAVHCSERGTLLEAIRTRYNEVTQRLIKERRDEIAALERAKQGKLEAVVEENNKRAKRAMLFARAAAHGQKESLAASLDEEKSSRVETETKQRIALEGERARTRTLSHQITELRGKLESARAMLDAQLSLIQTQDAACALPADDQTELLSRLILRPPTETAPPLMASLDEPTDRTRLLLALLKPLPEEERFELLSSVMRKALPSRMCLFFDLPSPRKQTRSPTLPLSRSVSRQE